MKAYILKCEPGTQFHFGKYAPDSDTALNDTSEIIHSDTLFSAIINTYDSLNENTSDLVKQFDDGNIRISSGFFCIEHAGDYIWFLPKPVSFDFTQAEDQKTFRKIKYLSKKLWENTTNPASLAKQIQDGKVVVLNNRFALLLDEIKVKNTYALEYIKLYYEHTHPKVHVRKETQKDSLYQLSTIEIADNSDYIDDFRVHYYFLSNTNDSFNSSVSSFEDSLRVLVDSGIGAERFTIGKLCGLEIIDDWQIESQGNFFTSLSLLSPGKDELEQVKFYSTIFRGGRRTGGDTGFKILKSVRMISEGAILESDVIGSLKNISSDDHSGNVYLRNGVSLNISIPETWQL